MKTCPVGKQITTSQCTDEKCLHLVRGNCEYTACSSASSIEDTQERVEAVARLYEVKPAEIRVKVKEIMLGVLANAFFEHLFQKPILDCRQKEVDELLRSESKYYAWRKKKTPEFESVVSIVKQIVPKL